MRRVAGLARAARPVTTLAILITPGASAFLAAERVPPLRETVIGGLVAATAIASAHIFNDLCDRETDRLGRRTRMRPLARGMVPGPLALGASIGLLALSVALATSLNRVTLGLLLVGVVVSVTYSGWLKRTGFGFVLPALGAALLPLGAWSVYRPESVLDPTPLLLAGIGFSFELVPYWCQSVLDVEADRLRGLRTLPARLGTLRTSQIMVAVVTVSLTMVGLLFVVSSLSAAYLGVAVVLGMAVLFVHLDFIFRHDPRRAGRLFVIDLAYITLISVAIMAEVTIESLVVFFGTTVAK